MTDFEIRSIRPEEGDAIVNDEELNTAIIADVAARIELNKEYLKEKNNKLTLNDCAELASKVETITGRLSCIEKNKIEEAVQISKFIILSESYSRLSILK